MGVLPAGEEWNRILEDISCFAGILQDYHGSKSVSKYRTFVRRMYHHHWSENLEKYVREFCFRFSSPELFKNPIFYLKKHFRLYQLTQHILGPELDTIGGGGRIIIQIYEYTTHNQGIDHDCRQSGYQPPGGNPQEAL